MSTVDLTPFVGVPYIHKGESYEGSDCWGLCKIFYRDCLGIELPRYADMYDPVFDLGNCGDAIAEAVTYKTWVPATEPQFATLLTFRIMGHVAHVGIYLGEGDFLHAFNGTDSCIESLNSVTWANRLHGMYDLETRH